MALGRQRPSAGLMHHSDRGRQYACQAYQRLLETHDIHCSMSRKEDCLDKAVAERFFGSLKRERTAHGHYATLQEAQDDVIDYIEMFYNSRRKHSYLGYASPNEYGAFAKVAKLHARFHLTTTSPAEMAELAKGRLRQKRAQWTDAIEGRAQAPHRFVLTERWCQIDHLDETIARFDAQIEAYCAPFEEAVALLDPIPGVARQTAEIMVAEIGTEMGRFPTADHLAAWAGVAPGNHESAGKRRSGQTRKGDKPLGVALNQAAHAASRTKHTDVAAQYRRLAGRRGKKKAIVAVRPFDGGHRVPSHAAARAVPRMGQ
jgi:hypothetical protein